MKSRARDLKRQIHYLEETQSEMRQFGIKKTRILALINSHKKELAAINKKD